MTPEQIAAELLLRLRGHQPEELMDGIAIALREARNQGLEEAADLADNFDGPKAPKTWSLEEQYAYERGNNDTCVSLTDFIRALKHKDGQP